MLPLFGIFELSQVWSFVYDTLGKPRELNYLWYFEVYSYDISCLPTENGITPLLPVSLSDYRPSYVYPVRYGLY